MASILIGIFYLNQENPKAKVNILQYHHANENSPQAQALILQYHHVSESTPQSTSISPVLFKDHLELIKSMGFSVLPLPTILKKIKKGLIFEQRTLAITFDDGYLSIYENAYPLLKSYNFPFTIFVSPKAIDSKFGNSLSWEMLREMKANGATIANHSFAHDHLLTKYINENDVGIEVGSGAGFTKDFIKSKNHFNKSAQDADFKRIINEIGLHKKRAEEFSPFKGTNAYCS